MEAQHPIPSDKMDSDAVITIIILNVKFTHLELCVYTNLYTTLRNVGILLYTFDISRKK